MWLLVSRHPGAKPSGPIAHGVFLSKEQAQAYAEQADEIRGWEDHDEGRASRATVYGNRTIYVAAEVPLHLGGEHA